MNNTRTCKHGNSPTGCKSCSAALDELLKTMAHVPDKKLARMKVHKVTKRQEGEA